MKKQLLSGLAFASLATGIAMPSSADVTATAGFVSDYIYRGSQIGNAGAYASVDYENSGFYAGSWAIMDAGASSETGNSGTGLEVDYYLGYGTEFDNGLNFSLGYTAYTYTYNANYLSTFEDELGGSIGYKGFAASAYYGWKHVYEGNTTPYMYYDVSWSGDVFSALVGRYEQTKDAKDSYNYAEISAGGEIATLDMSVTLGKKFSQKDKSGKTTADTGTGYIVLDVSKTFSL